MLEWKELVCVEQRNRALLCLADGLTRRHHAESRGWWEGYQREKGSVRAAHKVFPLSHTFFFLGFHPFCLPVWTSTLLIHKTGDPATAEPIASPKCHFGELQIGPCSSERLAFRKELNVSRCSWHFLIIYVCLILLCVMLSLWKSNLRALFQGKLGVSSFC